MKRKNKLNDASGTMINKGLSRIDAGEIRILLWRTRQDCYQPIKISAGESVKLETEVHTVMQKLWKMDSFDEVPSQVRICIFLDVVNDSKQNKVDWTYITSDWCAIDIKTE